MWRRESWERFIFLPSRLMAKTLLRCNHDILMQDEDWSTSPVKASLEIFPSSPQRPPGGRRAQGTVRSFKWLDITCQRGFLPVCKKPTLKHFTPAALEITVSSMHICLMITWLQLYTSKYLNRQAIYSCGRGPFVRNKCNMGMVKYTWENKRL